MEATMPTDLDIIAPEHVMNSCSDERPINPGEFGRGATLRELFAAAAMQGLVASGCLTNTTSHMARPWNEKEVAEQAYAMADAMVNRQLRKK